MGNREKSQRALQKARSEEIKGGLKQKNTRQGVVSKRNITKSIIPRNINSSNYKRKELISL